MKSFYLATVDTRHFNFTALGATEDEAVTALMHGWHVHCTQVEAIESHITRDDVRIDVVACGQCLRDGNPLADLFGSDC